MNAKGGKKLLKEKLNLPIKEHACEASTSLPSRKLNDVRATLVVIIGGCTQTEIAAIRKIGKRGKLVI